jgi:FAD/FMN-containing dehydrogenase
VHVVRYGMMRDLTLGLEVVLADGRVMHGLKSLRKDNTGYDLRHIFIGAEGTLGVISAASLKLFPKPGAHIMAMAGLEDAEKAIALLNRLKSQTGALSAFELMGRYAVDLTVRMGARDPLSIAAPWTALIEFESAAAFALEDAVENALHGALEDGLIIDAAIARNGAHAQEFWRLRETMPSAHKDGSAQCSHDTSVPVSAVPEFLRLCDARVQSAHPGARIVAFGHAGDGNIHYTVMQNLAASRDSFDAEAMTEIIHNTALELGGSISAEHGVGVIRRAEFLVKKDPAQIALMQGLKRAFDPLGILNPRVMV